MALHPVFQEDLERLCTSQSLLWDSLKGKSFFLTGGTGFFGLWLLHFFQYIESKLALNLRVTILSRTPQKFISSYPLLAACPSFTFLAGNVENFHFPSFKHDYIIHAATTASAHLIKHYPLNMLDTIVAGTRRVLDYAKICDMAKMLFVSSGAVYGCQPPELKLMPENYNIQINPLGHADTYAMGKFFAEYLCNTYIKEYEVNATIARCYAFLGPFLPLDTHYAAGNFILNALNSETIRVHSDGSSVRSYMYPSDLVEWLLKILINGEPGRAYNVGSDQAVTIAELAREIASQAGGIDVHISKKIDPSKPIHRYVPDVTRARTELSLQCRLSLSEAISRTLSALR